MAKPGKVVRWFLAGLVAAGAVWMNWPAEMARVDAMTAAGSVAGNANRAPPLNATSPRAAVAASEAAADAPGRRGDADLPPPKVA